MELISWPPYGTLPRAALFAVRCAAEINLGRWFPCWRWRYNCRICILYRSSNDGSPKTSQEDRGRQELHVGADDISVDVTLRVRI